VFFKPSCLFKLFKSLLSLPGEPWENHLCVSFERDESRLPAPSILSPLAGLPGPPGSAAAWGRLRGAVSSADPAPLIRPPSPDAAPGQWSGPASQRGAAGPWAQSCPGLQGVQRLPGVSLFSTSFPVLKGKNKIKKGNPIFHRLFGCLGRAEHPELWVQKSGNLCP